MHIALRKHIQGVNIAHISLKRYTQH